MRKLALIILLCGAAFGQVPTNQRALSLPAFVPNYNIPGRPLLSGLHISVGTGTLLINGIPTTYAATTLTMTDNTTNYVYVDLGTGLLTQNTAGFTSQDYPICTAVAVGGIIVTLTDSRPDIFGSTAVGLLDPGGNGLIFRSSFNVTRVATSADIVALFSGSCDSSHALFGDGTCKTTSSAFSAITTGANTAANMQVSTGATVAPLNLGQVASSQAWVAGGLVAPSTTGTLTGGLITPASTWSIQYTLNTAAGETPPSIPVSGSTQTLSSSVCNSGTSCTLTITAPTLGAYSSWNAYVCTTSAGPCTVPQKLASCTAITGNCVITASQGGNTSGVPTINTAWTQPPNVQANNGFAGSIPSWFFPKVDGNYYPWLGIDVNDCDGTTGPPLPCGTPLITHRTYFSDVGGATVQYPTIYQAYKNSFISVNHTAGVGTVATNQDRAIGVLIQTPAGDSATRKALEGIQVEVDVNGSPTINGSPDGEVTAFSGQITEAHTGGTAVNPALGIWGSRLDVTKTSTGGYSSCTGTPCIGGIKARFINSGSTGAGAAGAGGYFQTQGNAGDGMLGYGVYIDAPTNGAARSQNGNTGLYIAPWMSGATNRTDRQFFFDGAFGTVSKGIIQPNLWLGGGQITASPYAIIANHFFINSSLTQLAMMGSVNVTGSINTVQLANVANSTDFTCSVTGGTGTSYTYAVAALDSNGQPTAATSTCTVSAAATLDANNHPNIAFKASANYGRQAGFCVYRTASSGTPSSTGVLQCPVVGLGSLDIESVQGSGATQLTFSDTGIAATGTVPGTNNTGGIIGFGYGTLVNCSAVGTAASPSVASCANASAGSFSCATNATGATCTVNTTAVTANSQIFVQEDETLGTKLGVTCNTSTNVLPASRLLNARVAGTSFTINLGTVTTNPACFSYFLVN